MYRWEAVLANDALVQQGRLPYLDLFLKRLLIREFRIVSKDTGLVAIRVVLDPFHDRVIYRRRVPETMNARTGQRLDGMDHPLWIVIHQRLGIHHVAYVLDEVTGLTWKTADFKDPVDFPVLYDCERDAGVFCPEVAA